MINSSIAGTGQVQFTHRHHASTATKEQNFQILSKALSTGDLSSAQKAFTALTGGVPQEAMAKSGLGADLTALGAALQGGDIDAARQAFATLKSDMHGLQFHPRTQPAPAPTSDTGIDISA